MSARAAGPGFSMIELLIVVLLMAAILMGLFSLQDALLQQRGRVLRNIVVRNQNDYARRVVLRELASATVIQEPAATGGSSNNLVGWKNVDPSNIFCCGGTCRACDPMQTNLKVSDATSCTCAVVNPAPAALSGAIEWFRFCLSGTRQLVYYRGTGFALPAAATGACGSNSPTEIIAGYNGVKSDTAPIPPATTAFVFNRPRNNWVGIDFMVDVEGIVPSTRNVETAKAETHVGVAIMAANQPAVSW